MSHSNQKPILFSHPDITEAEITEVASAMRSGWITTGPRTKEFERRLAEYTGAARAVALNSATASMELVLRVLGVGPGDEVITTAYTYTATASVIDHVGATIRMVDINPDNFEMDLDQLEAAINPRTKVIMPVDIAGVPCDYASIYHIVENKSPIFEPSSKLQEKMGRICILADAAHALGARSGNTMAGSLADFSCFSFHAVKNLTTAEGGAITWSRHLGFDDDALYHEFMLLSLHGQSKDALAKTQLGAWEYDIIYPGYKCNMTDIMAAIGNIQLDRYPHLLARRKALVHRYDEAFQGDEWEPIHHVIGDRESSCHLYLLQIPGFDEKRRNELIVKLAEEGISTNVHYKPLPMMTAYKNLGFKIEDYPEAYKHHEKEITLPLHTLLSDEDQERIIEAVKRLRKEV